MASNKDLDPRLQAGSPAHIGFLILTAAACVWAFVGLESSSLWLDEMYTVYFSDPNQSSITDVIVRSAEDVHPPLYYVLVHLLLRLGGDFTVWIRGLSAALGIASLLILYKSTARDLSPTARAFMCAFASSSWGWWWYTQEARSYALCFFLGSILLALALRDQRLRTVDKTRFALVGVSILAALVHYYMLLLSGAIFAYLLIIAATGQQRLGLIISGLLVLVPVAEFLAWQTSYIAIDPNETWFLDTFDFLQTQILAGSVTVFGSLVGFIVLIWMSITVLFKGKFPFGLAFFVPVMTIVFGLGLTVLAVPMFSHRLFVVVLPFVWMFSGLVFDRYISSSQGRIGLVLIFAALLSTTVRFSDRTQPLKDEWRNASSYVQGLTRCQGATLPVVIQKEMRASGANGADLFYGHYLHNTQISFLAVNENLDISDKWQSLIQSRVKNTQACPVLLWSVSDRKDDEIRVRNWAKDLQKTLGLSSGKKVEVVEFSHRARDFLGLSFIDKPKQLPRSLMVQISTAPKNSLTKPR